MSKKWLLAAPFGAMLVFSLANAQDNNQGGGRGRGRGNFDPSQFRQMRLDRIKEELNSTDEEWKVLEAKVGKVIDAQSESFGGFGGFGGGRGGPGGRRGGGGGEADRGNNDRPRSKVAVARDELRDVLDNKSASSDEVVKKLAAYRQARDKAREAVQAAQKDLKELCTPRQEAVLVAQGLLE